MPIAPEGLALFERYMEELLRWQARLNLTGFRSAHAVAVRGFLDSLACLRALPPGPLRVIDIGSGAGFPGLPLRIARGDLALTLLEANRRRHSFLAHLCRLLGLSGALAAHGRAEDLGQRPEFAARFDVAFARAVRRADVAAALAAPFLRPGGRFVSQQGIAAASQPPALQGFLVPSLITMPEEPRHVLLVYQRSMGARFT